MKRRLFVGMMPSSSRSPKACRRAKLLRTPAPCPTPRCQWIPAGPLRLGAVPPEARCHLTSTRPQPGLRPLTPHFQVTVPSTPGAPGPKDQVPTPRGRRGNAADPLGQRARTSLVQEDRPGAPGLVRPERKSVRVSWLPKSDVLPSPQLSQARGQSREGFRPTQPGPKLPIVLMAPASRPAQEHSGSLPPMKGPGRGPPPHQKPRVCTSPSEER